MHREIVLEYPVPEDLGLGQVDKRVFGEVTAVTEIPAEHVTHDRLIFSSLVAFSSLERACHSKQTS